MLHSNIFSLAFVLLSAAIQSPTAFILVPPPTTATATTTTTTATTATTILHATSATASIESSVATLKNVLEREYISFFNPMRTEYYSKDVTFVDPMTVLAGADAYRQNVDMLASRTLLGKFLFENAGITLHSITGGHVDPTNGTIQDIITRWTLRVTAKVLPWTPTARFSGISIYKVAPSNNPTTGIVITAQTDYWDSINIQPDGTYAPVDKNIAISDFLNQLKPTGLEAATAAPELPFTLLRRGKGYQVRRYPAYTAVQIKYGRRDEGFGSLGAFCKGMSPLAPAVMTVQNQEASDKFMLWPLSYTLPGDEATPPLIPAAAVDKAMDPQWRKCQLLTIPSTVVAVLDFSDASMEPVVRKADRTLREVLKRDGIDVPATADNVRFAQYDAIFSMGQRRGEVWIELEEDSHPW